MILSYVSPAACIFDDFIEFFAVEPGKTPRYMLYIHSPVRFPDYNFARNQAVRAEHTCQDEGKTGKNSCCAVGAVQKDVRPPFGPGQPYGKWSQLSCSPWSKGNFTQQFLPPEEAQGKRRNVEIHRLALRVGEKFPFQQEIGPCDGHFSVTCNITPMGIWEVEPLQVPLPACRFKLKIEGSSKSIGLINEVGTIPRFVADGDVDTPWFISRVIGYIEFG